MLVHSRDLSVLEDSSDKHISYYMLGKYFKNKSSERKERAKPLRVENFR